MDDDEWEGEIIFAPRDHFLVYLAAGWQFCDDLAGTSHGQWSVMLERPYGRDRPTNIRPT